jgi:hypothetical protein
VLRSREVWSAGVPGRWLLRGTCSSEGVELRLEPFELFELDVQLVSYLNQEGFNP